MMPPALDLRYIKLLRQENPAALRDLSCFEQDELQQHVLDRRRRAGWIAARLLVKRLLYERASMAERRTFDPTEVSVLSRDPAGRSTRPILRQGSQRLDLGLSISHTHKGVLVGLARREGLLLGVDLAVPERTVVGSIDPWYTPQERRWVQSQTDLAAAAQLWTIKQAFYKAVSRGEPFAPRRIEVSVGQDGRFRCDFAGRSHELPAYVAVTDCDGHVAALVVVSPKHALSEVPASYDSIIPQSDLMRIGKER
jgi:phosphopantetheinyl transferase